MPTARMDLPKLISKFNCEDRCHEYLTELRWPGGIQCPRCESKAISNLKKYRKYECNGCRYQFTVRVGTVLGDSKLPLWKWFLTVLLMVESKKGISSNQIKRLVGVSYKTAWFLTHRIRAGMKLVVEDMLTGVVEVDETYVGGKVRGKGRGYRGNKSMVLGAIQRGGAVRLRVEHRGDRATLHKFIRDTVDDDATAIYTDENPAYRGIEDEDTKHETVTHSADEWVRGDVHTNTVEGVFSLLKRSVIGSYHHLSKKHLDAYLDEIEWRYNNRDNEYLFEDTLRALMNSERLEFKQLTAKAS